MLEVKNLKVGYGDIPVLWDLNFRVERGEIVALVGSNGAGKTTFLRALSGLLAARDGSIHLNGEDITATPANVRVMKGIAQVPEGRQLFGGMTVQENVAMGAYTRRDNKEIKQDQEWVWELFPELAKRKKQQAATLSGGEQQMVAIGRGLMARPQVLLIDELSLGLAPVIVDRLVQLIRKVHREMDVAIVFVEQDVHRALEIAQRGYVLENGRVFKEGAASALLGDGEIKKAYLGL